MTGELYVGTLYVGPFEFEGRRMLLVPWDERPEVIADLKATVIPQDASVDAECTHRFTRYTWPLAKDL